MPRHRRIGQYCRAGGHGEALGDINARHGNEPGVAFYTHISDQFGPYYTKAIAATASEAPHVLDGVLYHQTGLQIEEHYTDTGGVTDHVFGLCPLFGFRFAPRIRDLKDRRLYLFISSRARTPRLFSLHSLAPHLRHGERVAHCAFIPGELDGAAVLVSYREEAILIGEIQWFPVVGLPIGVRTVNIVQSKSLR